MQLRMALDEARQEGLAAAEKLVQHEQASRVQLQALQSALTTAQVRPYIQGACALSGQVSVIPPTPGGLRGSYMPS